MVQSYTAQRFQANSTATASQLNRLSLSLETLRTFQLGDYAPTSGLASRGSRWFDRGLEWGETGLTWGSSLGLTWGQSLGAMRMNDGNFWLLETLFNLASAQAWPYSRGELTLTAATKDAGSADGRVLEVASYGGDMPGRLPAIGGTQLTNVRSGVTAARQQAVTLTSSLVVNFASGHVVYATQSQAVASIAFTTVQTVLHARLLRAQVSSGPLSITWPSNIKWPGDAAPTLTDSNGAVDSISLFTTNQGSTWIGWAY